MSLFDANANNIGTRAKLYNEPIFQYYNESSRVPIVQVRGILDDWFARYPDEGSTDLRNRFRSQDGRQHNAAFLELYLHELLLRIGFTVEIHPEVDEPTHPDFLVSRNGERRFFLEATISAPSDLEVASDRRINQVYDTLNSLQNPDFFLALRLHGAPDSPPPGAALRRRLENWLSTLNWNAVQEAWAGEGFDGLPTYPWEHSGWSVIFQALPKTGASRGSTDVRPIGLTMPLKVHQITVDEDIKSAVSVKNKYGRLDLPFAVAVNVTGDFCSKYDVMNSLFGHETVIFGPGGTRPGERLHDGAWDGPRGPQNTTISAVMVFKGLTAWNMRSNSPWLVHNPWAARALDPAELPFSQFVPDSTTGRLVIRDGQAPGSFLALRDPWPPDED
jgi:hypothetical protein